MTVTLILIIVGLYFSIRIIGAFSEVPIALIMGNCDDGGCRL